LAVESLLDRLKDIAEYSFATEGAALASVVESVVVKPITEAVIWKAVAERPLSSSGELLQPWMKRLTGAEILQVESLLRKARSEGMSNSDITRVLRGTRENRYTDGMMIKLGRQNATLVRTAVQHVNSVARQAFWESNSGLVTGYRWLSVLDRRTSRECASLDGREFKFNEGPLPPVHPNCRSTTVAVLSKEFDIFDEGATRAAQGGPVPADMSYYEWLKTQPADFQDSVLGPTRGLLFRSGGMTVEEFTRLQLNSFFEPRTLEEMRKIAPLAFRRAGV
jgi:SPP1 gp7 family putative phage head morphogenesis protein